MIKADIAAETPRPCDPYANKHIGKPILPVLGIVNGGNSLMISLVFRMKSIIIPVIKNGKKNNGPIEFVGPICETTCKFIK